MNYKHELKRLGKRRKRYLPVMSGLLDMYEKKDRFDFPVELIDTPDILLLLELMDIEYFDPEAFTIRRRFGDIVSLHYLGTQPFTESGHSFFQQHRFSIALLKIHRTLLGLFGI
ncbi:MAG: hypothetical protein E4G96_08660 [Chrysiogenales bacterium]|nr:MAG: hypothetical protein E4G96_08660 [Chrysiogenales bacterium]